MEKEDGPFRNTRSSGKYGGHDRGMEQLDQLDEFVTPKKNSTITRKKNNSDSVNSRNKDKSRTPSGQILGTSVRDIRNFFGQGNESQRLPGYLGGKQASIEVHSAVKNKSRGKERSKQLDREEVSSITQRDQQGVIIDAEGCEWSPHQRVANQTEEINANELVRQSASPPIVRRKIIEAGEMGKQWKKQVDYNKYNLSKIDAKDQSRESEKEVDDVQQLSERDNDAEDQQDKGNIKAYEAGDPADVLQAPNNQESRESVFGSLQQITEMEDDAQNPKVMDVRTVIHMFQQLRQDFKTEIATIKEQNKLVKKGSDATHSEVSGLKVEVAEYKQKTDMLIGVVSRMNDIIKENSKRVENIEWQAMKSAVVLTGFIGNYKKPKCIELLQDLFFDEMGLDVEIEDIFYIGSGEGRPIVILLQSISQKLMILQAKENIKNLLNEEGKSYYLNEYFPAAINEKRRTERELYRDNLSLDEEQKVSMQWGNKGLMVDGKSYQSPVQPPDPINVLYMEKKELDQAFATKVDEGERKDQSGNVFMSYNLNTESHQDINNAYLKLRLIHPAARHIMCGFQVSHPEIHMATGFCDDQDHGGARVITNILKKHCIKNRAIFVVRYCEGIKLGKERFNIIEDLTCEAITKNPWNATLNENQLLKTAEEITQKLKQQPRSEYRAPSRRGRGGGAKYSARGGVKRVYRHRQSGLPDRAEQYRRNTEPEFTFAEPVSVRDRNPKTLYESRSDSWPSLHAQETKKSHQVKQ